MNPSHYRIQIDGKPLADVNENSHPSELVVTQALNEHARAEITLRQRSGSPRSRSR